MKLVHTSRMTTLPIDTLIVECIKGKRNSQKALYDLYAEKMFPICLRYSKNRMDAEDILQEGFIKLFTNLQKFRGEGSFEGWVRRIFVNTAIEHLRKAERTVSGTDELSNYIDTHATALDSLFEKDLVKVVDTMSTGYRTVFHLYAIEGHSHKDIARHLNITESTSKSQFSRAKAILRNMLSGRVASVAS